MNLQPNEKRLLIILAVTAIFALFFQYLLLPEFKVFQESSKKNESLVYTEKLLSNENGARSELETRYEIEKNKLNQLLEKDVLEYKDDASLDVFFTKMVLERGLKPASLIIEHPVEKVVQYQTLTTVNLTLGVEGSLEEMIDLMTDIGSRRYLKVIKMNTSGIKDDYAHTINIELTMLKR